MKNFDPYWTVARFPSTCAKTGAQIRKGERIYYYPRTRTVLVGDAAEQAARELEAAKADEEAYNAAW